MYIDLPNGDFEEGKIGHLLETLYGTRDAAAQWEKFYSKSFETLGFVPGRFSLCLFFHPTRNLLVYVHGDDMVFVGEQGDLVWAHHELDKMMMSKRRALLGSDPDDDKSITLLNRIVEWHVGEDGKPYISYEPDPRHVEILVTQVGLDKDNAKAVVTPGVKCSDQDDDT